MKTSLRWTAVPIAAAVTWYAVFILGVLAISLAQSMCPAEWVVSGICAAPWFFVAFSVISLGAVGLSAGLVVFVAALVAPSHKLHVAISSYLLGSIVAFGMALPTASWDAFASALIGGAVVLLAMGKWHGMAG